MTLLRVSNRRLWAAIAAVRLGRSPATMAELRDALNARRRMRAVCLSASELADADAHFTRQHRTYGRIETPWKPKA